MDGMSLAYRAKQSYKPTRSSPLGFYCYTAQDLEIGVPKSHPLKRKFGERWLDRGDETESDSDADTDSDDGDGAAPSGRLGGAKRVRIAGKAVGLTTTNWLSSSRYGGQASGGTSQGGLQALPAPDAGWDFRALSGAASADGPGSTAAVTRVTTISGGDGISDAPSPSTSGSGTSQSRQPTTVPRERFEALSLSGQAPLTDTATTSTLSPAPLSSSSDFVGPLPATSSTLRRQPVETTPSFEEPIERMNPLQHDTSDPAYLPSSAAHMARGALSMLSAVSS